MKFIDHYLSESIIHHRTKGARSIVGEPTIVPMPEGLEGKRVVCIENDANLTFTFVFENPDDTLPAIVYTGNPQNIFKDAPNSQPMMVKMLWDKHFTPQGEKETHPMKYGGEVRIHPPIEGYEEFPQDADAHFVTDFSPDTHYKAGEIISDPLIQIEKPE